MPEITVTLSEDRHRALLDLVHGNADQPGVERDFWLALANDLRAALDSTQPAPDTSQDQERPRCGFCQAEGTRRPDCPLCGCPDCQPTDADSQAFQQFREAMLSDAAVKALADECWPNIPDSLPEKAKGARVALEAALDAIDPTRKGEQQ
jgi:hypothetical protein